ncbi:hypothetical protein FB451DRAFT_1300774, partial [Mycena latifolia]
ALHFATQIGHLWKPRAFDSERRQESPPSTHAPLARTHARLVRHHVHGCSRLVRIRTLVRSDHQPVPLARHTSSLASVLARLVRHRVRVCSRVVRSRLVHAPAPAPAPARARVVRVRTRHGRAPMSALALCTPARPLASCKPAPTTTPEFYSFYYL